MEEGERQERERSDHPPSVFSSFSLVSSFLFRFLVRFSVQLHSPLSGLCTYAARKGEKKATLLFLLSPPQTVSELFLSLSDESRCALTRYFLPTALLTRQRSNIGTAAAARRTEVPLTGTGKKRRERGKNIAAATGPLCLAGEIFALSTGRGKFTTMGRCSIRFGQLLLLWLLILGVVRASPFSSSVQKTSIIKPLTPPTGESGGNLRRRG